MISPGEPVSLSGQDLLAEFARSGHEGPFEEIVRRYAGMVFNVCLKITRDKHEAEDATQAVFLTLAVQVKRGTEIKSLGPWLQQVARRLSLDMRRSHKRRKRREEYHHDLHTVRRAEMNDAAALAPDVDELKTILHEELEKLPAKYRLPLILHYFGGLSREEMAGELKCKPSTLGVRIFRGRQMLAGKLSGRGVSLPVENLALVMGPTVTSSMAGAAVRGSGHAAYAAARGVDPIGLLASRIIAVSRRAMSAVLIGKIKLAVTVAVLVGMSLCAGAKAAGMLPQLSLERLIVEPLSRLIAPLMSPISVPLQASASPTRTSTMVSQTGTAAVTPAATLALPETMSAPQSDHAMTPAVRSASAAVASAVVTSSAGAETSSPAATSSSPTAAVAFSSSSAKPSATDATDGALLQKGADAIAASTGADSLIGAGGGGGFGSALPASNDLYLPPAGAASGSGSGGLQMYETLVQVPTNSGKLLEKDGVLRGWGHVARTGTFNANGEVIADGGGVDHTLDLTGFTSIECTTANGADGCNGWYAVDCGKLDMRLQGSLRSSVLTWGDDPAATRLTLVNSVRMNLTSPGESRPAGLSLLALDRHDLPTFSGLFGVPIGLWEVDGAQPVESADVTIRYDDAAVTALDSSESDVRMWFLCGGSWQLAPPSSFNLDVADHLASGAGENFSYFALTVPGLMRAFDGDLFTPISSDLQSFALPTAGLPEPAGVLVLAVAGIAGLTRRRR